jgi:hypothetical protein
MNNIIYFLLCCGAYFFALLSIWAIVYVGAENDIGDMTEEEWRKFISKIQSSQENQ